MADKYDKNYASRCNEVCQNCGKVLGLHSAIGNKCPIKGNDGLTVWSETSSFKEKGPDDIFRERIAELENAASKMAGFITSWRDCLEGVQMSEEDFVEDCGLKEWSQYKESYHESDT